MKQRNVKYFFKSSNVPAGATEEELLAAGWKITEKGAKRPTFDAEIPAMETQDVVEILQKGGAGESFLLDTLSEVFYNVGRNALNEYIEKNQPIVIPENFFSSVSFDWEDIAAAAIAAAAETRSSGISKETWDAFEQDYISVMLQQMPQNGEERICNAAAHLKARFQKCRSNKAMVKKLLDYLNIYYAATSESAAFAQIFETLTKKGEAIIQESWEDTI